MFIAQPVMAQSLYEQYTQFQNTQNKNTSSGSNTVSTSRGQGINRAQVEERFDRMSTYERTALFNSISDKEKIELFKSLSESEQKLLLDKLSDNEKRRLLSAMDEDTRKALLEKFPELEELMKSAEKEEKAPEERPVRATRPEGPSRIEQLFAGTLAEELFEPLEQFGYAGFEQDVISFTPLENVPVGDDYVVGPDDNFTVFLWGKV